MAFKRARFLQLDSDHRPRRIGGIGVEEHRLLGLGVVSDLSSEAMSIGDSFHCLSGCTLRSRKRRRCSSRLTENQNLMTCVPLRTSMRSNSGA